MEMHYSKKEIRLDREEFAIDRFTRKFVSRLDRLGIRYVLISGYVAIAFGRSRNTEDVDLFVEKVPLKKFELLWGSLMDEFECINAKTPAVAYNEYLQNGTAIRFALKGQFIPNVEFKFPKSRWDGYSLENRVKLRLNSAALYVSPPELQIAFKGYLGSEKDIEDARFLYRNFANYLDKKLLGRFFLELLVEKENIQLITGDLK
jgi:hypothetical protein